MLWDRQTIFLRTRFADVVGSNGIWYTTIDKPSR